MPEDHCLTPGMHDRNVPIGHLDEDAPYRKEIQNELKLQGRRTGNAKRPKDLAGDLNIQGTCVHCT